MTKKEAIKTLIQSAHRDIRGSGMGYRSTSEEWREKVRQAIEMLWKDAYGWEMSESDKFNTF
jgi:hypothetical protein